MQKEKLRAMMDLQNIKTRMTSAYREERISNMDYEDLVFCVDRIVEETYKSLCMQNNTMDFLLEVREKLNKLIRTEGWIFEWLKVMEAIDCVFHEELVSIYDGLEEGEDNGSEEN